VCAKGESISMLRVASGQRAGLRNAASRVPIGLSVSGLPGKGGCVNRVCAKGSKHQHMLRVAGQGKADF
jgi:hypothetical protein